MSKEKIDIKRWLPEDTQPDSECSLLQIWSKYHDKIQALCRFNDKTTENYTEALKQIEKAPAMQKPASKLDVYDIWEAAVSAMHKRGGERYSDSAIGKRLSVIHDIYKYLEAIAVCADPLWKPPWKLVNEEKKIDYNMSVEELEGAVQQELRERCKAADGEVRLRALRAAVERSLIHMVVNHIGELDRQWFALALLVYLPIRLGEVCGLDLGDFRAFSAPERSMRCYIELGRAVAYNSVEAKDNMKNKNAVRRTVEPIELHSIRNQYLDALHRAGIKETDSLPAAPGKVPGERCMPARLSAFVKENLKKAVDPKDLELLALDAYLEDDTEEENSREKAPLEARILRRNAFTKLTAETPLDSDSQIRPIGGHETDGDYPFVFSEDSLWNILQRIDHRMILPELHDASWVTRLDNDCTEDSVSETVRQEFAISPEALKNGGTLVIDVDVHSPGDAAVLEFERKLPQGASVKPEHYYTETGSGSTGRVITDGAHWPTRKWAEREK